MPFFKFFKWKGLNIDSLLGSMKPHFSAIFKKKLKKTKLEYMLHCFMITRKNKNCLENASNDDNDESKWSKNVCQSFICALHTPGSHKRYSQTLFSSDMYSNNSFFLHSKTTCVRKWCRQQVLNEKKYKQLNLMCIVRTAQRTFASFFSKEKMCFENWIIYNNCILE